MVAVGGMRVGVAHPVGKEGGEGDSGVPGLTPPREKGFIVIPPRPPHVCVCVSHWLLQENVRGVHN